MAVTSLYATEEPGAGLAEADICTLEINIKYEVIPSIVCSVCLSFGLIYCFFGYRCFKMVMFFSGLMFSSAAVLLVYHKEPVLEAQLGTETKAGISLGMGVLCGLLTMLVSTMGLLLSGLQLGSLLSLAILVVVGQFHSLTPVWVPLSVVLAASIVTAVFTLQWQKLFTVIYTSVFGATTVMLCVDYLVGTFMLPNQVYDMLCQVAPRPLCWFNWAITGIWPVMSLIGVLVQWRFSAKGVSHTEAAHKKQKKHVKKHGHRESRRRPPPHRRRRPPPLKRYAGDVLAPSYLQSLKERQMGTGSSTSTVSTITHALIDFDFETGSMVPLTAASPVFAV
ncbi:transmembrane protein 198-like [Siniperca chuatsi]|uniref:transmembrane protein 198-like n=1 Tax=Siniperca chuatsi TaxID=119488 RepID=UPI001CE0A002|nr:transmembrane protein 198-like [Siniperca chuatsi]XP_044068561.1 transmembrane protein 198-like [Siniperca chuatsi]XP_044068562.1 transmembrane protein 198-like [Siniperca chuatsi]